MRPTPTKARPTTSRSPRRSSPLRQKGKGNNPPSARRSIKRGLEDSLGSPSFAETPVTKIQKSKQRVRSPGVKRAIPAVTSDKNNNTPAKNSSSSGGGKPKKANGRRVKMSPRTHGAAIANSLASPAIDSAFLMSSTAPITPSKRSTAESALHHMARNTKRGRNDSNTQSDDDNNNNTVPKKRQKKKPAVNARSTIDSQPQLNEQTDVEFVPKGKLEERWLKNFNKWKQSVEKQGLDDTANQSPLPKSWINAQRKEYKAMKQNEKTSMTQSKADLLESAGFTWDAPIRRPRRNNSSSSNNEEDAAAALVSVKSDVSKRQRKSNKGDDVKSDKSVEKSNLSKRTSPRKSRPTQFYHKLLGKEEEGGDEKQSITNTVEQKKDKIQDGPKTNISVSSAKDGDKCRKCGGPKKKGHICTKDKTDEDEKAVESMALLATSSDEKDLPTKQKREGKKRRSRGGRQKGSLLSLLEPLQTTNTTSKNKGVSSGRKEDSAKAKHAEEMEVNKSTSSKKTKVTSGDATEQNTKPDGSRVSEVEKAAPSTESIENEAVLSDDQPIASPFASSPLRTSNLECPESGSISVGQAQNSPAKKNVPESICIRELMMSCLTEEDKEEEKCNSEIKRSEVKTTEEEVDDGDYDNDDDDGAMKADDPLPNTPTQNKEMPLSTFSPLSMTSPLRANNLLETSYNDEPEVQDESPPHENRADSHPNHPTSKRRSASTSRRSNQMVKNPPRNISTTVSAAIATQTSERVDEAKQLQLIKEKQYQEKMAEFGKLELEAKMVTERMRQIEERMRQIQSTSISNDLREYDEMKRRASYAAETLRPSKRKMITSQRHYGSSEDDFSDEDDSHRNWRHSTHGRHGDRERSIKRRKIRSDSRSDSRRSRSPSRSHSKRSSQSRRSDTQRRRIEDSRAEDDRDRLYISKKQRKKSSKKKLDEAGGRHSVSQMDRTSLKSPYAVLRSNERKQRETRQPDEPLDAKLQIENDASDEDVEENDTAPSIESAKMPDNAREENKKDSDSSSTKQSSIEHAEKSNVTHPRKTQNEDKSKDPLYWLAGGESDSDEESWDFDGPMILPPPPA
eukprot:scaffold6742_cov164-Skeletonema_marinoi.AAC.9